jgi:hypothetical protein
VKIPDYISPVVAYRVWRWDDTGLKSLNGELWVAGRPLEATCRAAVPGIVVGCGRPVHGAHELPHPECSCGVYAAKSIEHLRQFGYEGRGIRGEVYLWGNVVEHRLGWRAQFAYPKNLVLPLRLLPFTLAELNTRVNELTAFGTDILVLRNGETIRLWKHGTGYDANGLDFIISFRHNHYVRQQQERMLKKGDRVAVLGRGIAVVERVDEVEAVIILGNGLVLRIPRKQIVLSQRNLRWECRIGS